MNGGAAGFGVDPQRLLSHAAELDALSERARLLVAELRDALSESGQPWGADEVGRSFSLAHAGPADEVLRSLEALPGRLGDVAASFSQAASAYRGADEEAADGIGGIGSVG
ncbi:Protein of unknown function (DUF2580) [Saccharomonospora marina XMU15]|uniref:PE domain-containing protein n=1 Tax=Saccharomonospora marina XMU15 TaxID=882083 RepID=H5X978_9PSEU|nr:Protein of unknown function (DUF2580) [Saccharomonospora marina]EHR49180.1 Protein of unknown function (DUF2580) [Saccharomonospora marina XMU15]